MFREAAEREPVHSGWRGNPTVTTDSSLQTRRDAACARHVPQTMRPATEFRFERHGRH